MYIEANKMPPQFKYKRVAASETIKAGDRESSLADSRSFSDDEDGKHEQEEKKDLDQRIVEMEKRLVALNLKMASSGLNVRYTYSIKGMDIEITVRDAVSGAVIRRLTERELDKVDIRLAEMSGLLIDYNL